MTADHATTEIAMSGSNDWFTIQRFGLYGDAPSPPVGPWHGEDAARKALRAWIQRTGSEAGSAIAAMRIRVHGPYATAAAAKRGALYSS